LSVSVWAMHMGRVTPAAGSATCQREPRPNKTSPLLAAHVPCACMYTCKEEGVHAVVRLPRVDVGKCREPALCPAPAHFPKQAKLLPTCSTNGTYG
jgi:hypothetical protein